MSGASSVTDFREPGVPYSTQVDGKPSTPCSSEIQKYLADSKEFSSAARSRDSASPSLDGHTFVPVVPPSPSLKAKEFRLSPVVPATIISDFVQKGVSLSSSTVSSINLGSTTFGILDATTNTSASLLKSSFIGSAFGYIIAAGTTLYKIYHLHKFSKEDLFQPTTPNINDSEKAQEIVDRLDLFVNARIAEISDEELAKYSSEDFNLAALSDEEKKLIISLSKKLQSTAITNEFILSFRDIKERLNSTNPATKKQAITDAEALIQTLKTQNTKQLNIHIINLAIIFVSLVGYGICIASVFCPALLPVGCLLVKIGTGMVYSGFILSIANTLYSMSALNKKGFKPDVKTLQDSINEIKKTTLIVLKKAPKAIIMSPKYLLYVPLKFCGKKIIDLAEQVSRIPFSRRPLPA